MIIYPEMEQGSEEWKLARAGKITASNYSRILTPTGKDSSQWESFSIDLMAECIRPDMIDFMGNRHTRRGNELEPEAREKFQIETGITVKQVGFVTRDDGLIGCSPDGLIYQDNLLVSGLEIKCPEAKTHAKYLLEGKLPAEYKPQVHGSMAVCELDSWHFKSYCQGMANFTIEVKRDDYTDLISSALDRFLVYYSERFEKLMPILLGKNKL